MSPDPPTMAGLHFQTPGQSNDYLSPFLLHCQQLKKNEHEYKHVIKTQTTT